MSSFVFVSEVKRAGLCYRIFHHFVPFLLKPDEEVFKGELAVTEYIADESGESSHKTFPEANRSVNIAALASELNLVQLPEHLGTAQSFGSFLVSHTELIVVVRELDGARVVSFRNLAIELKNRGMSSLSEERSDVHCLPVDYCSDFCWVIFVDKDIVRVEICVPEDTIGQG